jgi:1-aminocyclopropane-1-carboxylate deaminase/D-cysteine desulfhydrase-like pyridoxal-dependent ACC family enzyme
VYNRNLPDSVLAFHSNLPFHKGMKMVYIWAVLDIFEKHMPDEKADPEWFGLKNAKIYIRRDDLNHPEIQGNKLHKLKYYIREFYQNNHDGIISFGGAWSNHVAALAAACRMFKMPVTCIIRGERPGTLSDTLKDALTNGVQLHFIGRTAYRNEPENHTGDFYVNPLIIPEGGCGEHGIKGCTEILGTSSDKYRDYICSAGTGTMALGLIRSLAAGSRLHVVPAIKGKGELYATLSNESSVYGIDLFYHDTFHRGGYAKADVQLLNFIRTYYQNSGILLDPVYTGKLFMAIPDLYSTGYLQNKSKVWLYHSGGIQGVRGYETIKDLQIEHVRKHTL